MKFLLLASFVIGSLLANSAPSDSNKIVEIEVVIHQLFEAIRTGDTTLAKSVLHGDARLMSTYEAACKHKILTEEIEGFLSAIGTSMDEL